MDSDNSMDASVSMDTVVSNDSEAPEWNDSMESESLATGSSESSQAWRRGGGRSEGSLDMKQCCKSMVYNMFSLGMSK